jgi:prevent-host-death family protein
MPQTIIVSMKTASVTELKAQLAHYLRMVRRGTEVQVLERGVPIARLVGIQPASGRDTERIERLAKAGVLRRGSGDLSWVLEQPRITTAASSDLGEALSEDREDRF